MTLPQPIRPWRLAAGVLLHLAVPLYLLTLAGVLLPPIAEGASSERLAALAAHASLAFLICFLVGSVVLTGLVRAAELLIEAGRSRASPRLAGGAPDTSRTQVETSLRRIRSWRSAPAALAAEARLSKLSWHHDDPRVQAIANDLNRITLAFDPRLGSGEGGAELDRMAADVIDRLAAAAELVSDERRQLDDGDARTLARYIELRYPSSDLTGA